MPKTLIIVPAYNEASALRETFNDLRKHCNRYAVVVVNDASQDETEKVARSLGLTVISLPTRLGIGGAVQTGFRWAILNDFDVAVQFDGDGQHQARHVERLIKPVLENEADLVIGSRYLTGTVNFRTTFFRRCGMVFFASLFFLLTGTRITDTTSGFRAYSRNLMKQYIDEYPADFPDMPVLLAARKKQFRIREIAVEMNQRTSGVSSTHFWKSLYYPFKTTVGALATYLRK